jgi:hypothetical protein
MILYQIVGIVAGIEFGEYGGQCMIRDNTITLCRTNLVQAGATITYNDLSKRFNAELLEYKCIIG